MATTKENLDTLLANNKITQEQYSGAIAKLPATETQTTTQPAVDNFSSSVQKSVAERNAKTQENIAQSTQQPTEETNAQISTETVQEKPKTEVKTTDVVDYQDDSEERLSQIMQNLNNYYSTDKSLFSNIDNYRNVLNYNKRSVVQKQILDSFFNSKQQEMSVDKYD